MTLRVTYIGGPTMLLDFDGTRILTDPTFDPAPSDYPSGPVTLHKLTSPAIQPEQLGSFDYVLLSHDHHSDNLDRAGRLALQRAKSVLTVDEGAQRLGGNSIGLKPWQTHDLVITGNGTLRVVATPARHGPAAMDRGAVIGFVIFFTDSPEQSLHFWRHCLVRRRRGNRSPFSRPNRDPSRWSSTRFGSRSIPSDVNFARSCRSREGVQRRSHHPNALRRLGSFLRRQGRHSPRISQCRTRTSPVLAEDWTSSGSTRETPRRELIRICV